MNKKEIKEIKEQMYYLDSELYSYQDIDNLKEYAKNLEQENQQLNKQKDDVVKYCNKTIESLNWKKRDIMQILIPENGYLKADIEIEIRKYEDILRMLGEIK